VSRNSISVPQYTRSFASPANDGPSPKFALVLQNVTKRFQDGRKLFENVNLAFFHGAKIGILGSNGSGKSSLLKIIAGLDKDIDGECVVHKGFSIGYLEQEPMLNPELTVGENIMESLRDRFDTLKRFDEISMQMGEEDADIDKLLEEQALLQNKIDENNDWDLANRVQIAMDSLRCPPAENEVTHLSGGERRRVALCRLLLSNPSLLLLDEPTNHLDAESVLWLEKFLKSYSGLVIAITHDRYFLDNVAGFILEIDAGALYPFKGNYEKWMESKQMRLDREDKKNRSLEKQLSRELEWVRKGVKGQQVKNKARLRSFEEMKAEKQERIQNKRHEGGALLIPEGPPFSNVNVLSVRNLAAEFDGRVLFRNLNFDVKLGDIIGVVGGNGSGKSTLLRFIMGDKKPAAGEVEINDGVFVGYNEQSRDHLDEDEFVWKEIVGLNEFVQITPDFAMPARQYVAQFNFNGGDQTKRIGALSGGERNRVSLAKSMVKGINLLILDEPTNDLDVATLRALEDAINDWGGCAVVVSHDRWFLDRIANRLLVFGEGENGQMVRLVEGGWSAYEQILKEERRDITTSKKKVNVSAFNSI
jgi:ATP-binding cassette ChvD family protein